MSDNRSRMGEAGGDFAASRPLSWSDRLRGALLGGAVGDVLGSGVRGWSLSAIRQWLGVRGVLDFLPVFGRRGAVSDLSQLTVFTMDALLRARATGEQDPLPVIRSNHLAWLHTQGVPWPYAMSGYWRSHPEPTGWLLRRSELFSTRNPGGNALRLLSTLVDRVPGEQGPHFAADSPAGDSAFADCLVWTAPLMVWSGDARRVVGVSSRVPRLLTTHYETRAASALHADVLGGLLNGLPLWEAVRSWEVNRSHLEYGVPPAAVLRTMHAAMFIAQQGQLPDPRMLDIEFCPSEGLGELGIAFAAVASAGNFTDAVITAVNHSADSAIAGALAGQLAGAVHGADAIPGRWTAELELREVLETLASDAAEAFAPPPPPRWARRYVAEGGQDRRVLNSSDWTVEAGGGASAGGAEEEAPPTQIMPAVVDGDERIGNRSDPPILDDSAEAVAPRIVGEAEQVGTGDTESSGAPLADEAIAAWEHEQFAESVPEEVGPASGEDPPDAEPDDHRPEAAAEEVDPETDRIVLEEPTSSTVPHDGREDARAETWQAPDPSAGSQGALREGNDSAVSPEGAAIRAELRDEHGSAYVGSGDFDVWTPEPTTAETGAERTDPVKESRPVEDDSGDSTPDSDVSGGEPPVEESRQPGVEQRRAPEAFGIAAAPPGRNTSGEPADGSGEGARIKLPGVDELPPLPEHRPHRRSAEAVPDADGEAATAAEEAAEESAEWNRSPAEESPLPMSFEPFASVPYMESGAVERLVGGTEEPAQEVDPAPRSEERPAAPAAAQAGAGGGHAVVEESDAEVPSSTERILGCLLGSATGDALGAGITEASTAEIVAWYGPSGPSGLPEYAGASGAVTAATQTTLFTCEGLIRAREARAARKAEPFLEVRLASQRWLYTQGVAWQWAVGELAAERPEPDGWLLGVPELFAVRSPGSSVYAELEAFGERSAHGDQPAPVDNSAGCGALVRATPAAFWSSEPAEVFELGVRIAALTHGHPSGYLPAGALAVIVQQVVLGRGLDDGVWLALQVLETWQGHEDTTAALARAADLAASGTYGPAELERQLGEGRRADEALGIAVCAALTAKDVRGALRTAVGHSGNSSATGAVCGSIVGALLGVGALPVDWLAELELRETVERMAMDCVAAFDSRLRPEESTGDTTEGDSDWLRRYPIRTRESVPEAPAQRDAEPAAGLVAESGADSWSASPSREENPPGQDEETVRDVSGGTVFAAPVGSADPRGGHGGGGRRQEPAASEPQRSFSGQRSVPEEPPVFEASSAREEPPAFETPPAREEPPAFEAPPVREKPPAHEERGGAARTKLVALPGSLKESRGSTGASEEEVSGAASSEGGRPAPSSDGDAWETNVLPAVTERADEQGNADSEASGVEERPAAEERPGPGGRNGVDHSSGAGTRRAPVPGAGASGSASGAQYGNSVEPAPAGERPPKPAPRRINSVSTGELDLTGDSSER